MELDQWLTAHGLEKYFDIFRQNDIGVDVLAQLTEEDLKEMGVPIGARRRFFAAVNPEGHSPAPQPSPEQPIVQPDSQPAAKQPPVQKPAAPAAQPHQQQVNLQPASLPPVKQPAWPDELQTQEAPQSFSEAPVQPVQPAASVDQTYTAPLQAQASQAQATRHQPKAKNSRKATAIMIAVGVHVGIILLATTLTIFAASKNEPEIIATIAPPAATPQQEMKKKTVQKQIKRAPSAASAAAAPMAIMMKANAEARFTTPEVTRTSTGPLGVGEGDLGSGAFGVGTGLVEGSAAGGVTFFGMKSESSRVAIVVDFSASMYGGGKNELMRNELKRTVSILRDGSEVALLFFSAPYWNFDEPLIYDRTREEIFPTRDRVLDMEMRRKFQKAKYVTIDREVKDRMQKAIRETPLSLGTNWRNPLYDLLSMKKLPGSIFFMTDGDGGDVVELHAKLDELEAQGKTLPVFHVIGLGIEEKTMETLETLSKRTGGKAKMIND